jgi:hypothetical protein
MGVPPRLSGAVVSFGIVGLIVIATACGRTDATTPSLPTAKAAPSTAQPTVPPSTTVAPTTVASTAPPPTASSTTIGTSRGVSGCSTSSLTIASGQPDGAGGSFAFGLTFTNSGLNTCSLFGFPGVSFVGSSGAQVGFPAARSSATPVVVTLQPGQNARALLVVPEPAVAACPAATAMDLRVYPPGQTASVIVPLPGLQAVCSSGAAPGSIGPVLTTSA